MKKTILNLFLIVSLVSLVGCDQSRETRKVMVFSKTSGFRHSSIELGAEAMKKLGKENGFEVITTEDENYFTEDSLKQFSAVVFLNTTGDVLNAHQQADFERYIQAGGGFVGIHAASDTEKHWPWYTQLVGAHFKNHPAIQEATLVVHDIEHPSTEGTSRTLRRKDEWYNYLPESLNNNVSLLISIDESSYEGGEMGKNHGVSWYHEFDGGRSFYTAMGHTEESYSESFFLKHVLGGIEFAIGKNLALDYGNSTSQRVPEFNRFRQVVLAEVFDEPMELEVLRNGDVLFIERKGKIKRYDATNKSVEVVAELPVHHKFEDGLLGLAIDPNYYQNNHIYLFYSPAINDSVQFVSRFTFKDFKLDSASEKVLLEIPVQRRECCHAAGSLEFDNSGNLFISVGDNTNPFFSDGFGPMDDRAGREPFDARGTSSNSQDLRGKILRIHPEQDGSYTIPDGNLFPKDGSKGRAEIYVMGCRNPFRFSIDPNNYILYWGDVGPDAAKDSLGRGPRGHDEINQAKKPGYYGWPLFVANNKPYNAYNFQTGVSGNPFDPEKPVNTSSFNTGARNLPPANPAFIWYPYAESSEFPLLKTGSRNAMAGPFYQHEKYDSPNAFPSYFDDKVLIYDWMRGWMFYVSLDENLNYKQMEPFLPELDLHNAIDMQFGPDGTLYILEYGTGWFSENPDAKLSKIEFNPGNRPPIAKIETNKTAGALPLTVNFDASASIDYDNDNLTYKWFFDGQKAQSTKENASFTYRKAGQYRVKLEISDTSGATSETFVTILAGNAPPEIKWKVDNQSFYWGYIPFKYEVEVSDREDREIDPKEVTVQYDYLPEGHDKTLIAQGHQEQNSLLVAEQLIKEFNCISCHSMVDTTNVGPPYEKVSEKYQSQQGAQNYLVKKIQSGGTGVWGDHVMPAQPGLTNQEATSIATYILSLKAPKKVKNRLPLDGVLNLKNHVWSKTKGTYLFEASYTDKGARGMRRIASSQSLLLRNPQVEAEDYEEKSFAIQTQTFPVEGKPDEVALTNTRDGQWIKFADIDLSNIAKITLDVFGETNGKIEMRLDVPDGELIGEIDLREGARDLFFKKTNGIQTVYFVFRNESDRSINVALLNWLMFVR